jgi:tripartite-type tricarboxylate transporter receptor subunit TctC
MTMDDFVHRFMGAIWIALVAIVAGATTTSAQSYPTHPIHLVVPFSTGGSVDTVARLIGLRLSDDIGQPIVIDDRPGAGPLIGTEVVAKATPDGYTLLMINSSSASAVSLYRKVPYDLMRDFAPIATIGYTPYVLVVHPKVAVETLARFVALARAEPGRLDYASAGNGVGSHLAVELFKTTAGVDLVHVPYKGVAPAVEALVAGEASVMIVNLVSALPHVRAGEIHALALADTVRSPLLPNIPIMAEAGLPGYEFNEWYGLVAPAGTPPSIIDDLNIRVARIIGTADFAQRLAELGAARLTKSPTQFTEYLDSEIARYARLVQAAHLQLD